MVEAVWLFPVDKISWSATLYHPPGLENLGEESGHFHAT